MTTDPENPVRCHPDAAFSRATVHAGHWNEGRPNPPTPPKKYTWTPADRKEFGKLLATLEGQLRKQLSILELQLRVRSIEERTSRIDAQVASFVSTEHCFVLPITSLAPKPFVVLKEIPILVVAQLQADSDDTEYVARFVEANVGSTGDSIEDAIRNVKDRLIAKFDFLDCTPADKLGPRLVENLAVLRTVIARA